MSTRRRASRPAGPPSAPAPSATATAIAVVTAAREEPIPDHLLATYVDLLARKFGGQA